MTPAPVRIGVLGAAKIAPKALIGPARGVGEAEVSAVAARDVARAEAFAQQFGIPRVSPSYQALIEDPDIDAVYIALPISLHHEWTLAALASGKHVLCEKPLACNASEAEELVAAAASADRVMCEAFHWRYHPLAARIAEVLHAETIGPLRTIAATFTGMISDPGDIRYNRSLGGGSTMDLGSYCVQWVRFVGTGEPEVVRAHAKEASPGVDLELTGELRFTDGTTATITSAMDRPFTAVLELHGEAGTVTVTNPLAPHLGHSLRVARSGEVETYETVSGKSSYDYQLAAFVRSLSTAETLPTGGADSVANMRVIDALYTASGMGIRGAV